MFSIALSSVFPRSQNRQTFDSDCVLSFFLFHCKEKDIAKIN